MKHGIMSYVLSNADGASLVKLKQLALSKLKRTSALRTLILSEPDELPKAVHDVY
jgi:hypothetical protein